MGAAWRIVKANICVQWFGRLYECVKQAVEGRMAKMWHKGAIDNRSRPFLGGKQVSFGFFNEAAMAVEVRLGAKSFSVQHACGLLRTKIFIQSLIAVTC